MLWRYAFWERQVHGMLRLAVQKNLITLHEFRKAGEALLPETQETFTYLLLCYHFSFSLFDVM